MAGAGPLPELGELVAGARPAWHRRAACRGSDLSFFPVRGESLEPLRKLCAGCSVRVDCASYALGTAEVSGVWAGTTTKTLLAKEPDLRLNLLPESELERFGFRVFSH
jgi:hypothetical protein